MTWRDNRNSVPERTCWVRASILLAGVTLLSSPAATSPVAGYRRRAASPASCRSVASSETVLDCFILEELYPGVSVGNIVTDYGLRRRYPSTVVRQLRFRFLTHSTPAGRLHSLRCIAATRCAQRAQTPPRPLHCLGEEQWRPLSSENIS